MWKYSQSSGELFDPSGSLVSTGYAGKGDAKNQPEKQCELDRGPIPRGYYSIKAAVDHPKLGPVVLPLEPDADNEMCERSGFFIHGDKVSDSGNASEGCIIINRSTRETVDSSPDKRLRVVRDTSLSQTLQQQKKQKKRRAG